MLACPASLKGVLSARAAADALAAGFRRAGVDCATLPVADGGEGTADVLPGVIEAASVIPFDAARLDPTTSSRPLGELIAGLDGDELVIALGGTLGRIL